MLDYELWHEGVARKSGRYPWGSGANPHQRNTSFLADVDSMTKKGMTPVEIAKGLGISTTDLRAYKSIAKNEIKKVNISEAIKLDAKGLSKVAIGEKMGLNESSVRALLAESTKEKADSLNTIADTLKSHIGKDTYLDIGAGTENHLGIAGPKLNTAVAMLKAEGYEVHTVKIDQVTGSNKTTLKVLVPPGTQYVDVVRNQERIKTVAKYSEDNGQTFKSIKPPVVVSAKRVDVRWAQEGGAEKDGVIELRRGVDDISLGNARYAQVRIAVEGGKYLKGMAMYSDNMPDGVDIMFNTNKDKTDNKLDAMKPLKTKDPDLPFGSIVRQKTFLDGKGREQQSVLNIVGVKDSSGEEGGWATWSKTLSSQMLSKQSPVLAKQQLGIAYDAKKTEFDEIMALNNPVVKKKLLESFADGADSSSVHLKAAGLPRTANHVILPINSLKDHEIYAPKYNNGEKVVLIRHPHGGTFEIPELTVNNRNKEANSLIKQAKDAVGINSKVAERLSGADFDGDTVLVIPNPASGPNRVKTSAPLAGLRGFDPKTQYKKYDGMQVMTARAKAQQMGDVSNLITDMTIKGAPANEIVRAVRHSMVVIDAEKHELNYKLSAKDNGIKELKARYQGKSNAGASTLISRAKSEARIDARKPRSVKDGGPIDLKTGEKKYQPIDKPSYVNKDGVTVPHMQKSTKMYEAKDARSLISKEGTVIEMVYADHANKLKTLANEARKTYVVIKPPLQNASAKVAYKDEVASLKSKLNTAQQNAPLERQAQILAKVAVNAKKAANPDMEKDELKRVNSLALTEYRARVGAKKTLIDITDREWAAIQAGAISGNMLENILTNTDLDKIKSLATPRQATVMGPSLVRRAKAMMGQGHTQAEIASALGVSVSTLTSSLDR